jgi:exodeoxyribonuclease VII large subunit
LVEKFFENSMADKDATNLVEYSVSELSNALKHTVEDTYGHVRVRGELGRISRPASGHIYLDLKDDRAVLAGVIWKGVAASMRVAPEQGLEVIATGRLTTYPGQSKYQIVIERIEPAGVGALMALLEEWRKKFTAEGLFDDAHKQPLPYLPDVIGVVTSPSGAVIRDILHRLSDRFPRPVLVWPVRVQGETSAAEVAAAINGFNALAPDGPIPRPDLIIVARGGGSVEDLWGFNEEIVVRAAYASNIPLISAIGHETDWTLLDHAADMRAPTPTAAAEAAVPVRAELLATVEDMAHRRKRGMARVLAEHKSTLRAATRGLPRLADLLAAPRQRLDIAASRIGQSLTLFTTGHRNRLDVVSAKLTPRLAELLVMPRHRLENTASRMGRSLALFAAGHRNRLAVVSARLVPRTLLDSISSNQRRIAEQGARLARTMRQQLDRADRSLALQSSMLRTLSHKGVLARGFALVRDAAGHMIRLATGLDPGQAIAIEFVDGGATAQITGAVEVASRTEKKKRTSARDKPKNKDQGSLF